MLHRLYISTLSLLSILMVVFVLAACSTAPQAAANEESLPTGDASRGAALFTQVINGAPACSTCHTVDGSTLVGPSLQGYAAVASTRIEGVSASDYTHTSIIQPASYIVSGFSNAMYNQYERSLSSQEIADLIAYLLTL